MADWYVSSVTYAALPQWAASTAYTVGQVIRPLTAPAFNANHAFRCTTAGTSGTTEPGWVGATGNNTTATSGTAIFTNVTGQGTYGWGAAAGNIFSISFNGAGGARAVVGDRIFVSSDHSETLPNAVSFGLANGAAFGVIQLISVNRAGSVPPGAVDYLAGATIIFTANGTPIDALSNEYWQGITLNIGATVTQIYLNSGGTKSHYFKNCAFVISSSTTTASLSNNNPAGVTFDNTTVQFSNAGQRLNFGTSSYAVDFKWINTPAAILGTIPTNLFAAGTNGGLQATLRGVDLSALTTTLYQGANVSFAKFLLDSCRIASGLTRLGTASYNTSSDEVELVNCYDGTRFLAERHTPAGDITTEFTITLSGGAQDDVGTFSHRMVSSVRSDKYTMTLDSFWLDVENQAIGAVHVATVEIVSSLTLNNDDISLLLEFQGTAGSSIASFVNTLPINALGTPSAITASPATWNSLPATPVTQRLQVSFTPLVMGRVRGLVRLGRPSTTVYVNPVVMIS